MKKGKATKTYLGIEDKVPEKVGNKTAKKEKIRYEGRIFLKPKKRRRSTKIVIKNSKRALKKGREIGSTVAKILKYLKNTCGGKTKPKVLSAPKIS